MAYTIQKPNLYANTKFAPQLAFKFVKEDKLFDDVKPDVILQRHYVIGQNLNAMQCYLMMEELNNGSRGESILKLKIN